jgi:hypothetical protein
VILEIRLDSSTKFSYLAKWAKINYIYLDALVPYRQSQNRVSESANRIILKITRAIRIDIELPMFLWPKYVRAACYILNRLLTIVNNMKTPYEK